MRTLSWLEVHAAAQEVVRRARADHFVPDHIVGIAVGGCVPLALIAEELGIKDVSTITARSYGDDKKQDALRIRAVPEIDIEGKDVLLVDEIADTGMTLQHVSELLFSRYRVRSVKTATLVVNAARCKNPPDYRAIDVSEWVKFPWDRKSG